MDKQYIQHCSNKVTETNRIYIYIIYTWYILYILLTVVLLLRLPVGFVVLYLVYLRQNKNKLL